MSLDKVIHEIKGRGEREASATIGEAQKKREAILAEARASSGIELEAKKKDAVRISERAKTQESSNAELEGKRMLLLAKKELFDEVYKDVLSSLLRMPPEKNQKILSTLLSKIPPSFKGGYISYNKKDADILKKLAGGYEFLEAIDCMGGFVIENRERTMIEDYRYEVLLASVWENSAKPVAKILFANEPDAEL